MGEVAVHLDEDVVAVGQPLAEAGPVRRAEARPWPAVQHLDLAELGADLLGQLAGAVRAVVVGHEDVDLGQRLADPTQEMR